MTLIAFTLLCLCRWVSASCQPEQAVAKISPTDTQQFETLGGFKRFSEVLAVGLKAGREVIKQWKEDGRLPSGLVDDAKGAASVQRANRLR